MTHDTTVHHDPDATDWEAWWCTCAEGDFTSDRVTTRADALDSAAWHAEQNGGTVINDGSETP